jgi:hypothetical protein
VLYDAAVPGRVLDPISARGHVTYCEGPKGIRPASPVPGSTHVQVRHDVAGHERSNMKGDMRYNMSCAVTARTDRSRRVPFTGPTAPGTRRGIAWGMRRRRCALPPEAPAAGGGSVWGRWKQIEQRTAEAQQLASTRMLDCVHHRAT